MYFDPLSAEHFPLTAQGRTLVNAFGKKVGEMFDETTAIAVAMTANAGVPEMMARNREHWRREGETKAMLMRRAKASA